MSKDLKGTKTEKNLQTAFAGESQAHMKYLYYASQAKKDGYVQIRDIFLETARNEKEHAKLWFKALHDDAIPATVPNLVDAAAGEHYEWTDMYAGMAKDARDLADAFEGVGKIEKRHEARYNTLKENIEKDIVFQRDTEETWICENCGHIHIGKTTPEECPVCKHKQEYFKLYVQDF